MLHRVLNDAFVKKTCVFLITILGYNFAFTQSAFGDIESYLGNVIATMVGSSGNNYSQPSSNDLILWGDSVTALINGDISLARDYADSVNYQVVEYTDTTVVPSQLHYVLEEKSGQSNYWGTYVFNLSACRQGLVLQSPHPKYDFNTGYEAVFCYKRLSAKAIFLSGTHRCNHSASSTCSGTTSSCGGSSQPFKISDMAHNAVTAFQKTTEALDSLINNSVFIQLHGFSKQSSDPYVIISNGTRDTPITDYATLIKDGLVLADNSLTFKIAHTDLTWTRLIGFSNTQGRLLNNSSSPCNIAASVTSGKFVHIEQEKSKLRQDSTGWNKMFQALASAFTCSSQTNSQIASLSNAYRIFPNPASKKLQVEANDINQIQLIDITGKVLFSKSYNATSNATIDIKNLPKGMVFITILAGKRILKDKIIIN